MYQVSRVNKALLLLLLLMELVARREDFWISLNSLVLMPGHFT